MSLALDDLPRDPDRLLQQLRQMAEVVAQQNRLAACRCGPSAILSWSERDAAQAEIEKLRLLIRQLQRGRFGRRSERLDPDQLQLGLEDLEQAAAAAEAAQEEPRQGAAIPSAAPARAGATWAPCRRTCRGSRSWSTSRTRAAPAAAGPCT